MIYVLGTQLKAEQLPLATELEYVVVNEPKKYTGVLSMGINKPNIVKCYVHNSITIPVRLKPEGKEKIVIFSSDEELVQLLKGTTSDVKEPVEDEMPIPEPEEISTTEDTTDEAIAEAQAKIDEADVNNENREPAEGITDMQSSSEIEEIADSGVQAVPSSDNLYEVDILRARLSATEKILMQNRACLEKTTAEKMKLYDEASEQINAIVNEYEDKLNEAEAACEALKAELLRAQEDTSPLSPFNAYAEKCRAVIKTGLKVDNNGANIVTLAAGSPDTTSVLYQSLALLAISGYSGVILDFTGDPVFGITLTNLACKVKAMQAAMQGQQLTQEDIASCSLDAGKDLVNYIRHKSDLNSTLNTNFGNARVACAGYYHDIALLTFDWATLISEVSKPEFSNNQPVVILLPAMTSFVSRYLVSYLSTATRGHVATICAPSALYSTQHNLNAVPAERIKLIALNYFKHPTSDQLLSGTLNAKYAVRMFKANKFFSLSEPTREDFSNDIINNTKIWTEVFKN